MTTQTDFLARVADDLYARFGERMADLTVVLPNQRARLFLMQRLAQTAGKPIWSPRFVSLGSLFESACPLGQGETRWILADKVFLVCVLWEEFGKVFPQWKEDIDSFYGWGEGLLNDFDNIDKNLAQARPLFAQVGEHLTLDDDLSRFDDETREYIQRFFGHFVAEDGQRSRLKSRFMELWNGMYELYTQYRDRLSREGLVYEGMLNRRLSDRLVEGADPLYDAQVYAFVGFNALNPCETRLFQRFKEDGKALFYWDYDTFYTENPQHEAGRFLRRNLERFGNALEGGFDAFLSVPKRIRMVSSPTETAQAHFAGQWLSEGLKQGVAPLDTAVVLGREALLPSLLHSLPDDLSQLNVTMGYPMAETPVFQLLKQITTLHTEGLHDGRFDTASLLPVLQNPYVLSWSGKASQQLVQQLTKENTLRYTPETRPDDWTALLEPVDSPLALCTKLMDTVRALADLERNEVGVQAASRPGDSNEERLRPLFQESLFQAYTQLSRLRDVIETHHLSIGLPTFRRLVGQVLDRSIPFSGEPMQGVQLMGILETRNLDFRRVLVLSANEGNLPQKSRDNSFIPYYIRKAYGLTGIEHKDAITSYYFFRFLQRAEDICLVYNGTTTDAASGEMSRFLLQLLMESGLHIEQCQLVSSDPMPSQTADADLQCRPYPGDYLSPSAIKTYLNCPREFFYQYVEGLKKEEEISQEVDEAKFGNVFHAVMQHLYTELMLRKAGKPCGVADVLRFNALKEKNKKRFMSEFQVQVEVSVEEVRKMRQRKDYLKQLVGVYFQIEVFKTLSDDGRMLRPAVDYDQLNGLQRLQFDKELSFLEVVLREDEAYAPFRLLDLETWVEADPPYHTPEGRSFKTGGIIDRVDWKDGVLRIVDYKTGKKEDHPKTLASLLDPNSKNGPQNAFQVCLYADMLVRGAKMVPSLKEALAHPDVAIQPILLTTMELIKPADKREALGIQLGDHPLRDFRPFAGEFEQVLVKGVETILSASTAEQFAKIARTPQHSHCEYCDFRRLCQR